MRGLGGIAVFRPARLRGAKGEKRCDGYEGLHLSNASGLVTIRRKQSDLAFDFDGVPAL
jgi:hypothetical protein